MFALIDRIPIIVILMCLLLGLAPFPMQSTPHVIEKLQMLSQAQLVKPVDIFDFLLHGSAALLVILKLGRVAYCKITKK